MRFCPAVIGLLRAAMVIFPFACAASPAVTPTDGQPFTFDPANSVFAKPGASPAEQAAPDPSAVALSDQEQQVSEIAAGRGDRDYLMIDKSRGQIILFREGRPVLSGPALTGESPLDRLPPGVLAKKFTRHAPLNEKVTPAGRFTVSRGHDRELGPTFDINEIDGKDWGLAIHQVYLGTPSEHRGERLRSTTEADNHITFGCINVTPDMMRRLMSDLPNKRSTPLYILPRDTDRTAAFFGSRHS